MKQGNVVEIRWVFLSSKPHGGFRTFIYRFDIQFSSLEIQCFLFFFPQPWFYRISQTFVLVFYIAFEVPSYITTVHRNDVDNISYRLSKSVVVDTNTKCRRCYISFQEGRGKQLVLYRFIESSFLCQSSKRQFSFIRQTLSYVRCRPVNISQALVLLHSTYESFSKTTTRYNIHHHGNSNVCTYENIVTLSFYNC